MDMYVCRKDCPMFSSLANKPLLFTSEQIFSTALHRPKVDKSIASNHMDP